MAKVAEVLVFMVLLTVIVESRDWRFEGLKRTKRGYNTGGFGTNSDTYGRSDEQNASVTNERLHGCSDEQGSSGYGSGSRELGYSRDGRSSDNRRRSFSKASATASASATAFNQNHNTNL